MSNKPANRLFLECKEKNPNISKIREYMNHLCCNNKEDINSSFYCCSTYFSGTSSHLTCFSGTSLNLACRMDHHEIVTILLDNSNDFKFAIDVNAISNPNLRTSLHIACEYNFPLTVRALLQHPNIDVNKVDSMKKTPLHDACCRNRKEVVMEVLKHPNIQVTVKGMFGRSPLHIACHDDENIDIIQMLLNHRQQQYRNIQLIATDNDSRTPLHCACSATNSSAVVPLLLKYSSIIDINASNNAGDTPLHVACSQKYMGKWTPSIIRNLLEQTMIKVHKYNKNQETPLDIIKRRSHKPKYEGYEYERNKQYYNEIIQLFEDYYSRKRWQIYYFLIKYDLNSKHPTKLVLSCK